MRRRFDDYCTPTMTMFNLAEYTVIHKTTTARLLANDITMREMMKLRLLNPVICNLSLPWPTAELRKASSFLLHHLQVYPSLIAVAAELRRPGSSLASASETALLPERLQILGAPAANESS